MKNQNLQAVPKLDVWIGVAEYPFLGVFKYLSRGRDNKGYRTYTILEAETREEALEEAKRAHTLEVDISDIVWSLSLNELQECEFLSARELERSLRDFGLTTVLTITGHCPSAFSLRAFQRLKPVLTYYKNTARTNKEKEKIDKIFEVLAGKFVAKAQLISQDWL